MREVYAAHLVAFGIISIAVDGLPAEGERGYEELVEEQQVSDHDKQGTRHECPQRYTAEEC